MHYPNLVGASVKKFYPVEDGNERSLDRTVLREVWNTNQVGSCKRYPRAMGGFRVVMNAGDPKSRVNFGCGGPNQITGGPGKLNFSRKDSVTHCSLDIHDVASTNVKYVYDSSDFTRYQKERSINYGYAGNNRCSKNNLTDYSYGGSGFPVGRGRQRRVNNHYSY